MNNELIGKFDQKVSELIEIIKKEVSGHKLTIEPDSDLLCQEEDGSFSILISLQIQQFQTDDGTVTPLPAEVTFDYRAEEDEWVMLVGQDGDEDLAVTRAGLFEVLFYYCSQAALTQQEAEPVGYLSDASMIALREGRNTRIYAEPTPWVHRPAFLHPPAAQPARCEYCNGSGDVHSFDGEWLGSCAECPPAAQPQVPDDITDSQVIAALKAWFEDDSGEGLDPNDATYEDWTSRMRSALTAAKEGK